MCLTGNNVVLEQELLIVHGSRVLELVVVLLDGLAKGAGRCTTNLDQQDMVERKAFLLDVCQQSLFESL
jgi:hypothetical protein